MGCVIVLLYEYFVGGGVGDDCVDGMGVGRCGG